MPWARIDDQFPDHPKLIAVGPLAGWLYICGMCYCARQLTDGFIPREMVRRLADVPDVDALVTALVTHHLWEIGDGGYQIHDYLEYNPPAAKTKERRKQGAARQARWKERKLKQGADGVTNASANGVTNSVPYPYPSPIDSSPKGEGAIAPTAETPSSARKPKRQSEKQRRVAETAEVFASTGVKFPKLTGPDAKALGELLEAGYSAQTLAECWRDIKTKAYCPDAGFADGQLSFQYLSRFNRVGNWEEWVESGRPGIEQNRSRSNGHQPDPPQKTIEEF